MPAFIPSPHQQAIFDWIATGKGSAIVDAKAGSGKSTTIEKCIPFIRPGKHVLGLAFNSSIAKEWKEVRLPRLARDNPSLDLRNVSFRTFHSLGFGAILKHLNAKPNQVATDGGKCRKLLRDALGEADFEDYAQFACQLVSLAKGEGIGAIVPDTGERWWALVRHHDLWLDSEDATEERALAIARDLLRRSNDAAKNDRLIDFDDQLYLPLLWRLRLWQHDYVFIDEAQDTNPVRRAIAKLALRPGGRLVAVGDPNQAIYGFTGASHDAMDLIAREFSARTQPLSVCYRCASAIVDRARQIVPEIEPAPGAPPGRVSELTKTEAVPLLSSSDAILCRQTAPLVGLAYELVARGVGCRIAGKDIASGLVSLIKKQRASGIDRLLAKLAAYEDREVAKFTARGEEGRAEAVQDRVECIRVVIDHLDERSCTVPALIQRLESMFDDEGGSLLTLSTVHKAKGKEWATVAILSPELMPSKWARQDWQLQQEHNLIYVAVTRAREHLIYLTA